MAVYTHLHEDDIEAFLTNYEVGELAFAIGIAQGVENTNYLIGTMRDGREEKYILTLYEKRVKEEDLPFFMGLMDHLAAQNIPCPVPLRRRDGEVLSRLEDKAAAMVTFLHGHSTLRISNAHTEALGRMVARMHGAVEGFDGKRENALNLQGWQRIFDKLGSEMDSIHPGMAAAVEAELRFLEEHWPDTLPRGVVHADLFPDNVFFEGTQLTGVIDFYFACEDLFLYDLAIVMNAWCFERQKEFHVTKAKRLLAAYDAERHLPPEALEALPVLARGAALRFLMTRAHDWIHRDPQALVTPHDPMDYWHKLRFHQQVKSSAEYGL